MMFRIFFILLLIPLSHLNAKPSRLTIFYTANRQGEVEPCGCQVHQIGGLNRMMALINKETKTTKDLGLPSLFVDAGDTFFLTPTLNPNRRDQDILQAKLVARAYKVLALDAMTPGERDFAAGLDALKELKQISGVPFVSANLFNKQGEPLFDRYLIVQKGDLKIAVTGLTDEKAMEPFSEVVAKPAMDSLRSILEIIKADKPDVVVLLSHLGLPTDREVAKEKGINVIIGSHSLDVLIEGEKVEGSVILQPQIQGQQLGIFDFNIVKPELSLNRLVNLDKDLDEKNILFQWQQKHKDNVRLLVLQQDTPGKAAIPGRPYVAHPRQCRNCHEEQHDFWEKTNHAAAYLVLYSKKQHIDPKCIGCHTLGFETPGGFTKVLEPMVLKKKGQKHFVETLMKKIFATDSKKPLDSRLQPERYAKLVKRYHEEIHQLEAKQLIERTFIGVQCEHCHGNRQGHPSPEVPTLKKVNESSCRSCHRPPNAPEFSSDMMAKIACPLMKRS